MYDAKIITTKNFSLCFSKENAADSDGTLAGAVTMGGTDPNLHLTPMVYASGKVDGGIMHGVVIRKIYFMEAGVYAATDATKETLRVIDVSVGVLNKGKVILDSGTTDTYFNREIASEFKKVFSDLVGVAYDTRGMTLTDEQVDKIPSLVVQLNGKVKDSEGPVFDPLDPDGVPGLAGKVDEKYPNDILVVVPPSHYFDYSAGSNKYVPR